MLAVPGAPKQAMDKVHALLPAVLASGKPAVVAALGDDVAGAGGVLHVVPREGRCGVPLARAGDAGARARDRVRKDVARAGRAKPPRPPEALPPPPHHGTLPEYMGKAYLAELGIPVPNGRFVTRLDDAKTSAQEIGYPVVLKAQAATLMHKTEAGGVILGIDGERGARRRVDPDAGQHRGRRRRRSDGILVEAMAPRGIEMIVGARRDPDWGPVLMVGLGGVWTETLHDVRLMPADLPKDAIAGEIAKLKGAALLGGLRGAPPADVAALATIAARIGSLIRPHPEIGEIEINPLVVYPDGVLALDVLVVAGRRGIRHAPHA